MLYARALLTPVSVDNRVGTKTPKEHEKQSLSIHKQSHSDDRGAVTAPLVYWAHFPLGLATSLDDNIM